MNASVSAPAAAPLLFNWDPPSRRKMAITLFVVASLIAHALCFYIFQIVYPPTIALLPPPARVSLISPSSEEGRTLLQWVGAEDPALAFATQRPAEGRLRSLPNVRHIPSYLAIEPALKQVPPLLVDLRTPSSQPPAAVPIAQAKAPPAANTRATTFSFSTELNSLGAPNLPKPSFAASSNESPDNIRFRVAVGPRGDVRYCFGLNASGDPALDEQARQYLMLCRFPGRSTSEDSGRSLVWGVATIEWGNDVAPPQATSKSTTGTQ
jgi:rhodanese-related sulfurtransferase